MGIHGLAIRATGDNVTERIGAKRGTKAEVINATKQEQQVESAIGATHHRNSSSPTPRLTFFGDVSFLNASVTPIHIFNQLPGSRSDVDRYGRNSHTEDGVGRTGFFFMNVSNLSMVNDYR